MKKIFNNISEIIILWLVVSTFFINIVMIILFCEYSWHDTFNYDYCKITTLLIGEIIYTNKPHWYTWVRFIIIPTVTTIILVIGWNFGKIIQKYKYSNLYVRRL